MKLTRISLLTAMTASVLGLAACTEESTLPRNGRHYAPISLATQEAMREKGMRTHSPIVIRAFKQESELEVWKQASGGKMELLKTYPMCRWSGQLGPKVKEGDRQVPEGFYAFSAGAMNPNSNYYLSFNVGYPNQLDRQLGRTGNLIMVHGDCSSMGCFAMTDTQIADIYGLTREAFAGGQSQIQMQSYPFRMTPENMAKYRNDPNMPFWKNLKQGNDHFEVAKAEPKVSICNGKYAFGADGCAPAAGDDEVRSAVATKQRSDEIKTAELVSKGTRAVKRLYRDGDMHPVFKQTAVAQANGLTGNVGTVRNGVSRTDALAFTPVEVPVEQYQSHKSKGRSAMQIAELVTQERINEESNAANAKVEPVKVEPVKVEPVKVEPAKVEPVKATAIASAKQTATPAKIAATSTGTAATLPATATALAETPAEAPQKSVFQRVMGTVGLSANEEVKVDAAKVEEMAPQRVTVPLPPRRQATAPSTVGPQASSSSVKVPDIISDTQRLIPSSMTGFSKLQ
jgi:murein L,D-transpeptidase YafK